MFSYSIITPDNFSLFSLSQGVGVSIINKLQGSLNVFLSGSLTRSRDIGTTLLHVLHREAGTYTLLPRTSQKREAVYQDQGPSYDDATTILHISYVKLNVCSRNVLHFFRI